MAERTSSRYFVPTMPVVKWFLFTVTISFSNTFTTALYSDAIEEKREKF